MAFELSSIVIKLKEKNILVNSEAIVIMLEHFLYLKIDFKVGWSMFSDKGSKISNF